MNKFLNIFYIILSLSSIVNCNGKSKEHDIKISAKSINDSVSPIKFLNQRYFTKYQLDPNHEYPKFYFRKNEVGEFSVNYVANGLKSQKLWATNEDLRNLYMGIETTKEEDFQINRIIKKKLESDINNYHKIAEYVSPKYLVKNSYDYIYPYKKNYYIYNGENNSWEFVKDKIISDGSDEKNITKLAELNLILGISNPTKSVETVNNYTVEKIISLEKLKVVGQ